MGYHGLLYKKVHGLIILLKKDHIIRGTLRYTLNWYIFLFFSHGGHRCKIKSSHNSGSCPYLGNMSLYTFETSKISFFFAGNVRYPLDSWADVLPPDG